MMNQDLINRQGPLDEASIASIAFDMAQGLHYMHSLNMLHRDIKPANILLDREVSISRTWQTFVGACVPSFVT